jgi:DNA-binding transcriptional regulator YdaS (Cro superfamily)
MSHRPISGQFNQVATRFGVKEATANQMESGRMQKCIHRLL